MNPTGPETIIRLQRSALFDDRISLHMAQRFADGRIAITEPLMFRMIQPEQGVPLDTLPLLSLDPTEAQHLIDELWHLGIRPTEGHGSTGQLAATEKHLNHLERLLDQSFTTVQNVVNASLLTPHTLPVNPK